MSTAKEEQVALQYALDDANPVYVLRLDQVIAAFGVSRSTILRMEAEGQFPKHVKLGNSILWIKSELVAFVEELKAKRDAPETSNT